MTNGTMSVIPMPHAPAQACRWGPLRRVWGMHMGGYRAHMHIRRGAWIVHSLVVVQRGREGRITRKIEILLQRE